MWIWGTDDQNDQIALRESPTAGDPESDAPRCPHRLTMPRPYLTRANAPARWFALFFGGLSKSGILTAAVEHANEKTPMPFEQWVQRRARSESGEA